LDTERVLSQVVSWATQQPAVRVVLLTGSAAGGSHALDALSDLDIELYVDQPSRFLDDNSWYEQFGEVLVVEALENPGWHPTRLVYYAGGKIDFMIAPVDALATAAWSHPFQVLVDKDGLATDLRTVPPAGQAPPDPSDFDRCNHWFYAAAIMCAKAVARAEPWQAKMRDWDAKQSLLQMIEWDHKARYGWSYATGHGGKQIDRWMDADLRAQLDECWAGFSLDDTTRALLASLDLFATLSRRTAEALGLTVFDAAPIRAEVTAILDG
jgi:aminoglycoside 6-adenylyltransferase